MIPWDPRTPEEALERAEVSRALDAALTTLPGPERAVLEGRLEGKTLRALGVSMGRGPERARQLEYRATVRVSQELARAGWPTRLHRPGG